MVVVLVVVLVDVTVIVVAPAPGADEAVDEIVGVVVVPAVADVRGPG